MRYYVLSKNLYIKKPRKRYSKKSNKKSSKADNPLVNAANHTSWHLVVRSLRADVVKSGSLTGQRWIMVRT